MGEDACETERKWTDGDACHDLNKWDQKLERRRLKVVGGSRRNDADAMLLLRKGTAGDADEESQVQKRR